MKFKAIFTKKKKKRIVNKAQCERREICLTNLKSKLKESKIAQMPSKVSISFGSSSCFEV